MVKEKILAALLVLTLASCRNRPPVYRPVDFVPDTLVHDDVPSAEEENEEMLNDIEDEAVMTIPDIPQESDLLQEDNRVDMDKIMKEGI